MSTESQEATKPEEPAAEVKADEPPAKKKRGAENQITKDDYDAGGDDDEAENDDRLKPNSFKRASDEVLAKRKIVRVRRNFGASAPAEPTTEASAEDKSDAKDSAAPASSNPFAKTNFASPSSSSEPKKVFGFGSSSGFGAAKSSTNGSSGFGSSSSSGFGSSSSNGFGNGSSSGFGGGFAGVGSGGKSSGFGSGSATGFVFGSSKSSSNGTSLFGNAGASNITFSLSSTKAEGEKKDADNTSTTKLPDKVELKTGEEDEREIYNGRCKSFEWVAVKSTAGSKPADTSDENGNKGSPTKANPSVQSSAQFQAAISSNKKEDADETETKPEKTNGDAKSSTEGVKHRWMELGIGPVKILQSKSNPERLRLVQRRESSKMGPATKVILNIPIWRESTCERDKQAQQYLRLKTMKEGKMCQYSLKFKENQEAGYFQHYLTECIPSARQCFTGKEE